MERQALFGSRIRSLRESANLSRETVTERAGISANYLGEIERGEKWPTLDVIERIGTAIGVSPSDFFEYEAEEVSSSILRGKLQRLLTNRSNGQLQQALRVLKALFEM